MIIPWRAASASLAICAFLGLFSSDEVKADWSSTSSTQLILSVNAAKGTSTAVGDTFAVSGAGLTAPTSLNTAGASSPATDLSLAPTAAGVAFNLNMQTKTADTLSTVDIDDGILPAYSDITVETDGTAGTLAGTISAPTQGTATAGGAGTTASLVQSSVYSVFD